MAAAVLLAAALGGGLLLIARRWLSGAGRAPRSAAAARMRGKTVIVTGANSGLGRATAAELLRRQARVILGCRDRGRAEQAAREIRAELGAQAEGGELVIRELDLASLRSVRGFCQRVLQADTANEDGLQGNVDSKIYEDHSLTVEHLVEDSAKNTLLAG